MILAAIGFLDSGLGKCVVGAVIIAALIGIWQLDRLNQRHIGAINERAATERTNNAAVKKADAIGARSRDPRYTGMRDPYAGPGVGAAE